MGRRKVIDRDDLLDMAEKIVSEQGARALTIDALAKAAGITKGGVQYNFGNKEALIDAMFDRWDDQYNQLFASIAGDNPSAEQRVTAHIAATRYSDERSKTKAASLMAALLQSPEQLASTRRWYRTIIADLDTSTAAGKRARLAFLAVEGAFVLKFFGLMEIDQPEWDSMLMDIAALPDLADLSHPLTGAS